MRSLTTWAARSISWSSPTAREGIATRCWRKAIYGWRSPTRPSDAPRCRRFASAKSLEAGHILGIDQSLLPRSARSALYAGYRRGSRRTLEYRAWCCPKWSAALRQATTILSSRSFPRRRLTADTRPQPLPRWTRRSTSAWNTSEPQAGCAGLPGWPQRRTEAAILEGLPERAASFQRAAAGLLTDRTVKFGFRNALDYQIIVNWVIAAHKSQGAYQMAHEPRRSTRNS